MQPVHWEGHGLGGARAAGGAGLGQDLDRKEERPGQNSGNKRGARVLERRSRS